MKKPTPPPRSSEKLAIVKYTKRKLGLAASSSTYMGYLWRCSVQYQCGVIRCTCDFSENTSSTTLTSSTSCSRNYHTCLELAYQWSQQNHFGDFWNFNKFNFFAFSLPLDQMGVKISKRYVSYISQPNVLQAFWIFFSKISNLPLYPMAKAKLQLSGKRAIVERKGVKFGTDRGHLNIYGAPLACIIQGHSV